MYPAFRSTRSAAFFCVLVGILLMSPILLYWAGLPSREQAFDGVSSNGSGPVGYEDSTIYRSSGDTDVVFVGSSLVFNSIVTPEIEEALSAHLGRPAHVGMLAMNWAGVDSQYFLLRDYLDRHKTALVVWNWPQPHAKADEPHVQSYRWLRYGESNDVLSGLPFGFRAELYGEMVLGAPRQLLAKLRPNLISDEERPRSVIDPLRPYREMGFNHSKFVPDALPATSYTDRYLMPITSPELTPQGAYPGRYPIHFAKEIAALTARHECKLVVLHMPTSYEFGHRDLPELANWSRILGTQYQVIGIPSAELFPGLDRQRFLHFYSDDVHFNKNGSEHFTEAITPSILEAYDESQQRR